MYEVTFADETLFGGTAHETVFLFSSQEMFWLGDSQSMSNPCPSRVDPSSFWTRKASPFDGLSTS